MQIVAVFIRSEILSEILSETYIELLIVVPSSGTRKKSCLK